MEDLMSTFRTLRPLVVDATQCEQGKTIATDTGFCNVSKADWIVRGENGETYVLEDAFFVRVHAGEKWELSLFACSVRRPTLHKDSILKVPVPRPVVNVLGPGVHPS